MKRAGMFSDKTAQRNRRVAIAPQHHPCIFDVRPKRLNAAFMPPPEPQILGIRSSKAQRSFASKGTVSIPTQSWESAMNFSIGLILVGVAVGLIFVGMPDKNNVNPRYLRFGAALVLYPPLVLVVLSFGIAEVLYSLMH
jgi:hypothetical protein